VATRSGSHKSTDAAQESVDRIRELNDRIVENARKAGNTYLEAYESVLNTIVGYEKDLASATPVDWIQRVIEVQADFTRQIGDLYASAAREALKK
jgi:capsid portal protein